MNEESQMIPSNSMVLDQDVRISQMNQEVRGSSGIVDI